MSRYEKYKDIFFPTTNALNEVNQSMIFMIMMVIIGISIIYLYISFKHLVLIFKNRENCLRQNCYIIFKILTIGILIYINYEIVMLFLEMS
ncbi:MAG: hypothetical protein RR144_05140 [Clostridia bacterium]